MRSALVLLCLLALSGCVPIISQYPRIEASDAVYYRSGCRGGSGPPSVVYYPFHGIFISFDLRYMRLGLHVPAGTTVQLNNPTLRLVGLTDTGAVDLSVQIKAFRHGALGGGNPPEFMALPDPFTSPDNFGPLSGSSKNDRYVWFLFLGIDGQNPQRTALPPKGLVRGTIELPSITINGQRYEPQVLPFDRESYSELSPINC